MQKAKNMLGMKAEIDEVKMLKMAEIRTLIFVFSSENLIECLLP